MASDAWASSAFFDIGAAGGMNFWGVFFFFLASPLSIPAALTPLEYLPFAMNILLLLKMSLCALTAAIFFRRFFPEMRSVSITFFGLMYAFSGFALNYYQNIVWLDMMALFPLLLLSLTAMMAHRKLFPFVLCLSAMLVVNYYLSYMVVLFLIFGMGLFQFFCIAPKRSGDCTLLLGTGAILSLLLTLFQFFCIAPKRSGDSILLLGTGAILSLLLTAPVWLPSLLEVSASARGQGLISSLSAGNLTTDLYTSLPVLLCTAIPAASLFLIRRRQTRSGFFTALAGCILFFLIPLVLNPINKMWHTGSYQANLQNYWASVDLSDRIRDDEFFRLKTDGKYFAVNFFSAMGYPSLSHYTSLTPECYLTSIRKLGYSGYWMEVNSNGGTAFSDALLGNRYILCRLKDADNASILGEDTVYWNHYYLLQKLPYRLPSAIVTDAEPGFFEELPDTSSRILLQQKLANALFPHAERLFRGYAPDIGSSVYDRTYTIPVSGEQILYFDCAAEPSTRLNEGVNQSCQILVNGIPIRERYPSQSENGILCLGTFKDETVTVTVHISKKWLI